MIRDVKPENFLFVSSQPDSPLKAIDFGMATYCSGAPDDWLCDRAGEEGHFTGSGTAIRICRSRCRVV